RTLRDALALLDRPEVAKQLNQSDDDKRRIATTLVGDVAQRVVDLVAELTALLEDKEPEIRAAAASALGKLGPAAKGSYPALLHVARNDPDANVRQTAQLAADRVGAPGRGDVVMLSQQLKDPRPSYRAAVAQTILMAGPGASEARNALREALDDHDPRVRVFAAQALWGIRARADEV